MNYAIFKSMSALNQESSMEEILASIKRIIAEDSHASTRSAAKNSNGAHIRAVTDDAERDLAEQVLELTDPVGFTPPALEAGHHAPLAAQPGLVSDISIQATRQALEALSSVVVRAPAAKAGVAESASVTTLDDLVVEMLRPMLKQWLDQHLPEIVEVMVQREIARITGK